MKITNKSKILDFLDKAYSGECPFCGGCLCISDGSDPCVPTKEYVLTYECEDCEE